MPESGHEANSILCTHKYWGVLSLESHWALHSMQFLVFVVSRYFIFGHATCRKTLQAAAELRRGLRGSRADLNTYFWFLTSMMAWKIKFKKNGKTRSWNKRSLPWEDCEKPQSRLVDASAEIRTAPLPTTNQQHYRLNQPGSWAEYLGRYFLNSGADQAAVAIRQLLCASMSRMHKGPWQIPGRYGRAFRIKYRTE